MNVVRRAAGIAARRFDRPELLAAVDPATRQAERDEVGVNAVLASALRADSTYVDVGTNRGQVLREAVRVAPGARHIAFEPIPELAAEVAAAFPTVDCRTKAVAAAPETTTFCHFKALDGWSGLRRSPQISDAQGKPEYIDVEVSTLDLELANESVTVIKIDVEGAELGVLEGGVELIGRARPLLIIEHVPEAAALYGATPLALWDLLCGELGYVLFSAAGAGSFARSEFAAAGSIVNWLAVPGTR